MRLKLGRSVGTYIAQAPHPLYDHLQLVVWWLEDLKHYSLDALAPEQVLLGEIVPGTPAEWKENVRRVLHGER